MVASQRVYDVALAYVEFAYVELAYVELAYDNMELAYVITLCVICTTIVAGIVVGGCRQKKGGDGFDGFECFDDTPRGLTGHPSPSFDGGHTRTPTYTTPFEPDTPDVVITPHDPEIMCDII